jgi:hypothetical protein
MKALPRETRSLWLPLLFISWYSRRVIGFVGDPRGNYVRYRNHKQLVMWGRLRYSDGPRICTWAFTTPGTVLRWSGRLFCSTSVAFTATRSAYNWWRSLGESVVTSTVFWPNKKRLRESRMTHSSCSSIFTRPPRMFAIKHQTGSFCTHYLSYDNKRKV